MRRRSVIFGWLSVLALVSVVGAGAAVAQGPTSLRPAIAARYPDVAWVDVPTLRRWMEDERPLLLLDARPPEEFRVSHLRGARRIDPDRTDFAAFSEPRDARVVVYCSVGWRSATIADRLRAAGFTDLHNLEGGIFEWANRGFPVFRGERRVRAVHPFDALWGRMLRSELRAYHP